MKAIGNGRGGQLTRVPDDPGGDLAALTLHQLAKEIGEAHRQTGIALLSGIEHARTAGELLLEAKRLVPHGEWLPWLERNVPAISEATAQRYMQLARGWNEIGSNPARMRDLTGVTDPRDLTIAKALKLLAAPRATQEADGPEGRSTAQQLGRPLTLEEMGLQWRHESATGLWGWDYLSANTFLLTETGMSPVEVASYFAVSVRQVELVLNPAPPTRFDTEANGSRLFKNPDAQAEFERHYNGCVWNQVYHWLNWAVRGAESNVKREGLPQAVEDRLGQKAEALWAKYQESDGHGFFRPPWDETGGIPWLMDCAAEDARAAVGIEPVKCEGNLLALLEQRIAREADWERRKQAAREGHFRTA